MASFEDELRSALQRREPSPDFTDRVLARVAAAPVRRAAQPWQQLWVRWVGGMAAALLLTTGGLEYRHYEGERAKDQVLLAMRIAGSKLNKAQRKVQMLSHRGNS
jgi:predicted lipid-binding transport protein (Tim44 family)